MQYNITILKQITRMLTVGILYFILFSTTLILYGDGLAAPQWLLGIPIILIAYFFIERYIYNRYLYFILHGSLLIPVLLIPFPAGIYTCLYISMLVLEGYHAIYIWKHNMEKPYNDVPWEIFLLLEIIYFIAAGYQYSKIVTIIFYCGILLLILHFVRYFLEGFHQLLAKSQNATSVPTRKMVFTSAILLSFVMLVFLLSALGIRSLNVDHAFYEFGKLLGNFFLTILKGILYIITLIRAYFAKDRHMEELGERKNRYEESLQELLGTASDPSLLARILNGILAIMVYAFLIYLIYRGFRYMYQIFLKRYTKDTDIVTTLNKPKDIIKERKDETTFIQKVYRRLTMDNREKLRQIYKVAISRHKEYHHKKSNTSTDIAMQIKALYEEDLTELTALYKKARYSNEEITSEDVKKGGIL